MVLGEEESVLFREVSLFQGCPYRGVPLYSSIVCIHMYMYGIYPAIVSDLDKGAGTTDDLAAGTMDGEGEVSVTGERVTRNNTAFMSH